MAGRNGDDGASVTAFELGPTFEDLPPDNTVRNVADADSRYWTWEITVTRRFTGRWSFVAGFAHTWYGDQASAYLGQSVRSNLYPLTPNDLINTGPNGQHRFRMWSAKIDAPMPRRGACELHPIYGISLVRPSVEHLLVR